MFVKSHDYSAILGSKYLESLLLMMKILGEIIGSLLSKMLLCSIDNIRKEPHVWVRVIQTHLGNDK